MKTEFDESVLDYWKLPNGNYIVKMKKDDGLDDDCDIKNTLPAVLGAFIVSNSKRIMNNFIREINGFYNNSIYYGDTDSLYKEKKILECVGESKFCRRIMPRQKRLQNRRYFLRSIFSS